MSTGPHSIRQRFAAAALVTGLCTGVGGPETHYLGPSELGPYWINSTQYSDRDFDFKPADFQPVSDKPRINDHIQTSIGQFTIEGFNVDIPQSEITSFFRATHNQSAVSINISAPENDENGHEQITSSTPLIELPPSATGQTRSTITSKAYAAYPHTFNFGQVIGDYQDIPRKSLGIPMPPSEKTELHIDTYSLATGQLTDSEKYSVKMQAALRCGKLPVFSEVVLTQPADKTCATIRQLTPLRSAARSIILNHIRSWAGFNDEYRPGERIIQLTVPFLRNRNGYPISTMVPTHEFTHSVYQTLDTHNKDLLQQAYKLIIAVEDYRFPTPDEQFDGYDVAANEPVWAVITEGTYFTSELGDTDPNLADFGHPWTNDNEMFASISVLLHTFPDALIERVAALPDIRKRVAVSRAVLATLQALQSASLQANSMKLILPDYTHLYDAFSAMAA